MSARAIPSTTGTSPSGWRARRPAPTSSTSSAIPPTRRRTKRPRRRRSGSRRAHGSMRWCAASAPAARSPGCRTSSRAPPRSVEMVLADPAGSMLADYAQHRETCHGTMTQLAGRRHRRGLGSAGRRLLARRRHLQHPRCGSVPHLPRAADARGHHRRHVHRHAAGGGAALLPRAEDPQARRHLRLRQRQQVPVQGLQRLLDAGPGVPRARAVRRPARPHRPAPLGARRGDGEFDRDR